MCRESIERHCARWLVLANVMLHARLSRIISDRHLTAAKTRLIAGLDLTQMISPNRARPRTTKTPTREILRGGGIHNGVRQLQDNIY
jgi:hypothetical protein